jgi:alkylhydroperoxidase/carboxymuconolactone decarboxylase family protein YurZ
MREVANHSGAMRHARNKKFGRFKQPAQEVAAQWQRQWSLAWLRVTSLQSQRDDLLNEIALLRARGPFPALAKATTLLTRLWDRATWVSREEILQAARVFVHIGKVQIAMAIPKHGRRHKHKPRKRRGSAKTPSKKRGRATPTVA